MKQDFFARAFELLIGHEGGYVRDPHDPGGETKYGISKRAHPDVDIANLSLLDAQSIYRDHYWSACLCDAFAWPVAYALFDAAVNMGAERAIRLLQTALGEVPDGKLGRRTRLAVKAQSQDSELITRFLAERAVYYARMGHFDRYGRGWMRRLFRVQFEAASFQTAQGEALGAEE